ncbi:NAD(P)-binding protein [Cylindrobasidium torrendii FP15055 ss-10]|uniref:NAD(P)-binding protein n=1 Tax=Cylindrobasidium torrendii FP15055 ss-10 TaxID=1314674 RepID=A0A0D7BAD0_9AGAR|nr:NAD(P)-binding protein [Cylindrobasidium torrendii FP15055 ss-10]
MAGLSTTSARLARSTCRIGTRQYHDLHKLPGDRSVLASGPPGYSAVSGHVVTVFGATGFLGRYLISKLARTGTQVIVPYRDEDSKRHLKLMGDLGQIVPMEWDIRREDQIAECLRHSDIVYNLTGRDFETKNFTYDSLLVDGAARIARIAREEGVPRFVHMSHLNASATSTSKFYQAKAAGEEAVKAAYDGPTIVRPAGMYGYEDKLLNNVALWPIWWKLNQASTNIRPVHVMDVAQVLATLQNVPKFEGTLNLPGASTFTYQYLLDLADTIIIRDPSKAPHVPKILAQVVCNVLDKALWWPFMSKDEIERKFIDDSDVAGDWELTGVTPTEIEQHALLYMRRYRSYENFARPPSFPPRPATVGEAAF